MTDPQDTAEQLDDDELGGEYPPEHPLGVDEVRGVDVDQDDSVRESLAEREARLVPEGQRPADPEEEPVDGDDDQVTAEGLEVETPEAAEEAALHVRGDRR